MLRLDWNIVFTIINLIVLYVLLKKFLIGPVLGIMNKRQEMIDSTIDNANQQKAQADELKEKYEGVLKDVREETQLILDKAKATANVEYQTRLEQVDEDTKRMIARAEETIRIEREQTLGELKSEIANLAVLTACKVLSQENVQEMSQSLYQQFLVEVGEAYDTNRK